MNCLRVVSLLGLCAVPGLAQPPPSVGAGADGAHLVTTRQVIRPAGETAEFGGRPVDLVLAPDGRSVYVKDNRGLVVLDVASWSVRQELGFPAGGGSMHGLAVSRDGARVYASTAHNQLWEAAVKEDGALAWAREIPLPGLHGQGAAHAAGIALDPDGGRAYVCLSRNNTLGVVDLRQGELATQIAVGIAPFDVVLAPDSRTAWVSNWGGRRPRQGEPTAPSSGTDVLIDERGIAASGTVSIVDLARGEEVAQLETGLHPSDLELSPRGGRLYVANANSDTVTVIDTERQSVVETIPVRPDDALPFGSAPNALALSPDGRTLYVANGGNNAVAVVALRIVSRDPPPGAPARGRAGRSAVIGFIPAGWYPGALAAGGDHLYIANVKGAGSRHRPPDETRWHVYWYLGTVSRVPLPGWQTLRRYTARVRQDARVPQILRAWEKAQSDVEPVPVPRRAGEPSVFEHVVYIIKENRTYDQIFGDLPQGNGDPELCLFGREVTPNHHALAEQFVLLDNFYCNGVNSADGHSWATEGNVTDHLEKAFGGFTRSYTFGDDPLTYSSSGFIWDNALGHGLSFRNYGEMDYAEPVPGDASFQAIYDDFVTGAGAITFSQNIGIDRLRRYSAPAYPGWNMRIPDVLRADRFLRELRQFERTGDWPRLLIVYLPQDHASGTAPGMPTPRAHLADNDLALGRVVEGISTSRFWPTTCIFVIEDDPQAGFDHVDGHRSICLVISPYTRRGAVISRFYNQTSVLHTMARILGLPPLNQMDSLAPTMEACFTAAPDFRPYHALPNRIPLDELNSAAAALDGRRRHWALISARLPLDRVDQADEDTLNRILWHAVKGVDAPYPAHLAGAHGTGLKALHLQLRPEEE